MIELPVVLVVDDLYSRDGAEWRFFLGDAGLLPDTRFSLGKAHLCSGQRKSAGEIKNDYEVVKETVKQILSDERLSLVLLDGNFDSGKIDKNGIPEGKAEDSSFGLAVREYLKRDFPNLPVVMLTDMGHDEVGEVRPFLSKRDLDKERMRLALLEHGSLTTPQYRSLLELPDEVVAEDEKTIGVFIKARRYAAKDGSVLLFGDTGVGKEVVARYIYEKSSKKGDKFVVANVASLSDHLVESELFGHKRGAFSDAYDDKEGYFEKANQGTLFLDEIGDLPLHSQKKILRVLQEKKVTRVGETKERDADFRLICATWHDLDYEVELGGFRQDLLYRIKVLPISIPSLNERKNDLRGLVEVLLKKHPEGEGIKISEQGMSALQGHVFEGNVRELQSIIARLVAEGDPHAIRGINEVQSILGSSTKKIHKTAAPGSLAESVPCLDSRMSLESLFEIFNNVRVDKDDPVLKGSKLRFEKITQSLLKKMLAASLVRCRNQSTGDLNIQLAMRFLTGNEDLGGAEPGRILNEVLGYPKSTKIKKKDREQELQELIKSWKDSNGEADDKNE